ncbi:DUF3574 domain-containing protein [Synechococcus sp. PCC 6312]|uniref:DUF3574 domain-containing protein n=1 Tax=Synechococcus sp. (strain ATCC 27167 / PCC 6312) TaxID=195253 RepID=UPI00029ED548|nr:DUF3574 domain-containing protein [Synechococcus sp. PCC 6312]AFY62136.1 Protein of unknown function (DUF3574) [Synechococcus sp. PCC 6312]
MNYKHLSVTTIYLIILSFIAPTQAGETPLTRSETNQNCFGCLQQHPGLAWQRTELFFGLSRPNGSLITPAKFKGFLDTEVAPRFKSGFTVIPAAGQYQDSTGNIIQPEFGIRNSSKALSILTFLKSEPSQKIKNELSFRAYH